MRNDKAFKLEELCAPGTRRVFEAIRMVSEEMPDTPEILERTL